MYNWGGMSSKRIPSLDGLRALAIGLVLVEHSGCAWLPHAGTFGVQLFFVISGYLITRLLLEEQEKHGRINLRAFYLRRCFRIFPAAFAYIAVVSAFSPSARRDIVWAVSYLMSYCQHPSIFVAHLWSLSVEEQFYLLWPLALVLCFSMHPTMKPEEIEALQRECFDTDFRVNGPSILRSVEVWFQGWKRYHNSDSPYLRAKAERWAEEIQRAFPVFRVAKHFGPAPERRLVWKYKFELPSARPLCASAYFRGWRLPRPPGPASPCATTSSNTPSWSATLIAPLPGRCAPANLVGCGSA